MYGVDTSIMGPSRCSPGIFYTLAQQSGSDRLPEVKRFLETIYNIAPKIGMRAELVVAQSIHETSDVETGAPWASKWWRERLNPAGAGVTGDPAQDARSPTFASGEASAKYQLAHLWLYAKGTTLPPELKQSDDPRWQDAISAGYAGKAPTLAGLNQRWAMDPEGYAQKIARQLNSLQERYEAYWGPYIPATGDKPVSTKLTFGKVPKFGMVDRQAQTAGKPEGVGWDNLGKRTPKFVVLHRMIGSLSGTDSWFASPSVGSLTDYGIGIAAQDGEKLSKVIYQWNDPRGYRAGWASGPVSAPYGDGAALVNKYGINVVNRDGVSLEISGNYDTPIGDDEFEEIARFLAYWFDQMQVPYDKAPINPNTGISAVCYHQEFTIGTGKICPGPVVMNAIDDLIARAAAIMRPYQAGEQAGEPTEPQTPSEPVPEPKYAPPIPLTALAGLGQKDADTAAAIVTTEGSKFYWVNDDVEAIRETPRLQKAYNGAPERGPKMKQGEQAHVLWIFTADDGRDYYYSDYATRFLAADFKRVKD